jgi:hypothetical protein
MRRRRLLGFLAAGTGVTLAGCGGGPSDPDTGAGPSSFLSATPTDSPTPTRRPGPAPDARVLGASATAADGTRVRADRWFSRATVEYETDDSAGRVEPTRGRFLGYDFTIMNVGDERLPTVRDSVFRLQLAGATFRHVHDLRGVPFSAVVDAPIEPLAWYDGLDPGASVSLQLVFDVPHRPRYRHYLAWDHPSSVEGFAGPVYLWPARHGTAGGDDESTPIGAGTGAETPTP